VPSAVCATRSQVGVQHQAAWPLPGGCRRRPYMGSPQLKAGVRARRSGNDSRRARRSRDATRWQYRGPFDCSPEQGDSAHRNGIRRRTATVQPQPGQGHQVAPKTAHEVDRRCVVNHAQACRLLNAVRDQTPSGPWLVAFFAGLNGWSGAGRTADLPLFRRNSAIAECCQAWPVRASSCINCRSRSPCVGHRLPALAPLLAPCIR
jgi:hypothetical protein